MLSQASVRAFHGRRAVALLPLSPVKHWDLGVDRLDPPVGQPVGESGLDAGPVGSDRPCQPDERWDATTSGPRQPALQQPGRAHPLEFEDQPQLLFEQVGAVQAVVDAGDPGELGTLAAGQVFRVLPQRVPGTVEVAGQGRVASRAGGVPHLAADLVERVGGPPDDMERVGAQRGVLAAGCHHPRDPFRRVRAHQPQLRTALGPRVSKNPPKVLASWPGAAHTNRPLSWSTTTVRYRWPFL